MAYQPKSYRKFLATGVTAAVVASAVAPVGITSVAAAGFSDVPNGAWYAEAVNELASAGVFGGVGGNKFNPTGNVTNAQAYAALAKALQLDEANAPESPFSDAKGHWAENAINALYEAGIIAGDASGKVNPDKNVTREQLTAMLIRALGIEEDESATHNFADVPAGHWAEKAIATAVKHGITNGLSDTEFGLGKRATRAELAGFLYKENVRAELPAWVEYEKKKEQQGELQVVNVSAINAEEIKLTFSKELNKASAEKLDNYKIFINGATTALQTGYTATLVDDKTVILKLTDDPLVNNETYRVNVEGVLTKDYKKVEDYKGTTTIFVDKEAPTLVETKVKGKQLSLKFNEPVTIANIKVDGNAVASGPVLPTEAGDYEVKYTLTDDQAKEGSHNVVLYGVTDKAGNETAIINTSYNVTADNSKPAVESITSVGTRTFEIKLNTEVASFGPSNVVIKKGNYTFPSGTYTVTKLDDPKKPNTYRVQFDTDVVDESSTEPNAVYAEGESSVSLSVEVKDFKGTNNIFGTNYTGTITLTKDTVAPFVQSDAINFVDGNNLVIVFNEEIRRGTGSITVVKDGIEQTFGNVSVDDDDKKRLKIDLGSTPNGTYEVVLGEGAVTDIDGNKNAAVTTKVVAKASKGTLTVTEGDVTISKVDGKNIITIAYGTEMTDSARNLANYKIDGVPLNDAFYAGAVAVFTNSQKNTVKITLPAGKHPVEDETKSIEFSKNISTEDGKIVQTADEKVVKVYKQFKDDKAPTLTKAEFVKASSSATSSKVIKLTFDENVKIDANIADDIVVKVGTTTVAGTVVDGQYTDNPNDDVLLVVLNDEVNVSQSGTVKLVEEGKDNTTIGILDLYGNKAVGKEVTLTDSIVDSGITNAVADRVAADAVIAQIDAANSQSEIEAARSAYNNLTASQKALVSNEDVLQTKEQALVDAVAAEVSNTFTASGAAGDVELPTVPSGYSIAVKTSSDTGVYDTDGKLVADGVSTVVYTVTHVASGKTQDTGNVTVTVTVTP